MILVFTGPLAVAIITVTLAYRFCRLVVIGMVWACRKVWHVARIMLDIE